MTTTEISPEYVFDRLSDPYNDPVYEQENDKYNVLEMELKDIERQIKVNQKRRAAMVIESSDDVDKAAKLDVEIDLLHRKAAGQHTLMVSQAVKVDEALQAAKTQTSDEAVAIWREELLPEVIDLVERLYEMAAIYGKLRKKVRHGQLRPEFPVLRMPELWLKNRQKERDNR